MLFFITFFCTNLLAFLKWFVLGGEFDVLNFYIGDLYDFIGVFGKHRLFNRMFFVAFNKRSARDWKITMMCMWLVVIFFEWCMQPHAKERKVIDMRDDVRMRNFCHVCFLSQMRGGFLKIGAINYLILLGVVLKVSINFITRL